MELVNIAILGPGGNVGTAIITELLMDGIRFKLTAITREESKYTPPLGVTHKTVDYTSSASLEEAFAGQDAVVNCITGGATAYEPSKLIIDSAVAAGVNFLFANEFVGYVTSEQFKRLPESHAGAKLRIRNYLQQQGDEGKIAWTGLNGGPFFDMWLMKGPAGIDVQNRRARIYGTGNNHLYWTPLQTMGLAAANMIRNPTPIRNRPVYICPFPHLTQNLLLSTVESVLDTKFKVETVDVQKINENAKLALSKGEPSKAMKGLTISNQFYEGDCGNDFSHLVENETVGVQIMSVEDAVRDAIAKYGENSPVVLGLFNVQACEV